MQDTAAVVRATAGIKEHLGSSPEYLSLARVTGKGEGPRCGEPASRRAPQDHRDSQHGAKPTTGLSTVRTAGRRGEATFELLIATHPARRGQDWQLRNLKL